MVFINDNDNRYISGVFGWDFNLILISRTSPGEVVFGIVPSKNVKLCPRKSCLSSSCLSQDKTIIGVPGNFEEKWFIFIILLFIVPTSLSCSFPFVPVET